MLALKKHLLGHTKHIIEFAITLKLFNKLFPDENNQLLENLTLSQYDRIFDALLENKDLKMIKEIIK